MINTLCSGRRGQVRPHHPADPEPFRGRVRPHHRGQLQEAGRHRWGDLPPGHTRHCRPRGNFGARGVNPFLQRESVRGIGHVVLVLPILLYYVDTIWLVHVKSTLCLCIPYVTHQQIQCHLKPVFRIHDILGWIRIRILGSMLPTNGSGFGSGSWIRILLFSSLAFKMPAKNYFLTQFFLLITFWRYIYIIFQRWKVQKSHKIEGIKVFLTIFAWW